MYRKIGKIVNKPENLKTAFNLFGLSVLTQDIFLYSIGYDEPIFIAFSAITLSLMLLYAYFLYFGKEIK